MPRPANSEVFAIKGALPIQSEQMLAPTRDFARPILGTVGQATKEIVDDSDGAWWPATRWACPGCRSGTTAPSAVRRESRYGCCR